jgi:DNA modification methylase
MTDIDLALFGTNLLGETITPKSSGKVSDQFVEPPFSVLDSRKGEWQTRKKAWVGLGLKGEEARVCKGNSSWNTHSLKPRNEGTFSKDKIASVGTGPSIFDPVLCELAYRWFCPEGGQVVDPFAGGSVRGIVAAVLGRRYWGCDLRQEQVEANRKQAKTICPDVTGLEWRCGDSAVALEYAPSADFIFSCPPYGNLERYSDDPRDLSAMTWEEFLSTYQNIIKLSVAKLKPDSFACLVVGDFRDEKGFYRNFVSETIGAFESCGARLYNEAVVLMPVGTACFRVARQFNAGRKLVKMHQNLLVFCKGNWRAASDKMRKE